MNYENNDMLTSPNLSYTSRDFNSIYNELMKSIPMLTKNWDPKDENDPGVVLIKMIAMASDMLSYNQDKQALEAFPRTVLQRANAQQIFRLIGYKMHWWRSALVEARFTNSNVFPIHIGRYNVFETQTRGIVYTNVEPITIPSGVYGDNSYKTTLIQGTPVTPKLKNGVKTSNYNEDWHTNYEYNVYADDIVNNRLYLKYPNIDESSITLIDNDETPFATNEWKQVKNINLSEKMEKVFEFDVDEDNIAFIQFPNYWNTKYVLTKFKLFFVLSDGADGEIEENTLSSINPGNCYIDIDNISVNQALSQVSIFNSPSTYGYNPETCTEARIESEKFINTIDTLVTLPDFEKAVKRISSVANVVATDLQNDPNAKEMTDNQVNLYIVRKSDYNNLGSDYIYATEGDLNNDELFKENIIGELKSYKVLPTDINVYLENYIDWIEWSVAGQIFLRKPINNDENYDLMVRINDNLRNRFNCETLDFNEPVNYMDVIECIMKTDKNIWHVDLDSAAIQYYRPKRSIMGNPTGTEIKNKYMIYFKDGNGKESYSGYYASSLGCTDFEIAKITPYLNELDESIKEWIDNHFNTSSSVFLAGTNLPDVKKITTMSDDSDATHLEVKYTTNVENIAPGGSGFGKNSHNRIVREDGREWTIGLFGDDSPREYEIYNRMIFDWTGLKPIFTGKVIDIDKDGNIKILQYDLETGELSETGLVMHYDSRIYLSDGIDSGKFFRESYKQIKSLCTIDEDFEELTTTEIEALSEDEIKCLLKDNHLRATWSIIDRSLDEGGPDSTNPGYTNQVVDILSGGIYSQRDRVWYLTNKAYNAETGEIVDTYGGVIYDDNMGLIKELGCREDITCEYIQNVSEDELSTIKQEEGYHFYLGQTLNGDPIQDSSGKDIRAFPIKPNSLFIYINGDTELLADTGSGYINSTPGLLDGHGTIDYSTGEVKFKLNMAPSNIKSMKIMYKVNKLTYAKYSEFDTAKLFVRPEYLKADYRK